MTFALGFFLHFYFFMESGYHDIKNFFLANFFHQRVDVLSSLTWKLAASLCLDDSTSRRTMGPSDIIDSILDIAFFSIDSLTTTINGTVDLFDGRAYEHRKNFMVITEPPIGRVFRHCTARQIRHVEHQSTFCQQQT